MAAMASASSLASQQFSGLRRSFSISSAWSSSTNALFFENSQSQIRFSTSRRAPRGVVAMAGSGKVRLLALIPSRVQSLISIEIDGHSFHNMLILVHSKKYGTFGTQRSALIG